MCKTLEWSLEPIPQAASHVRRVIRRRCAHLPAPLLDHTLLLSTELVTNAVRHGEGAVTVKLRHGPEAVRVEVTDASTRQPASRGSTDRDPAAEGGYGLRIVEALATRWGIEAVRTGKTVWLELMPQPLTAAA